ncbi:MAG: AAA family ATPase [Planctomycetes bacterium]|nr:AAA family ATPase [Planctomycetota bacterium]
MKGMSVAVIGPDGAGKTTLCRRLVETLPWRTRYVYMGVNGDASNRLLVTTRLVRFVKRIAGSRPDTAGPRDATAGPQRPRGLLKRAVRSLKSSLSLANRIADEWYRQVVAWWYRLRGCVVLFDRHYFADYYAYDIAPQPEPRSLGRRLHGLMLARLYPRPDLTIYLDAPAETLFARKREGTLQLLEQRRRDYLQVGETLSSFAVVDAARPPDDVLADVSRRITEFHAARQQVRP